MPENIQLRAANKYASLIARRGHALLLPLVAIRSRIIRIIIMKLLDPGVFGFLALLLLMPTLASAKDTNQTQREREQKACYDDAVKLCQEFVPDEAKITTCMAAKKDQLSPACLEVFESGMKAKEKEKS